MARAAAVLETAQACSEAGSEGEWTLLEGRDGAWHMVAGALVDPRAVASSRGAVTVLRVLRRDGRVRVEAWHDSGRCVLEERSAGQKPHRLIPEQRLYAASGCTA